MPPGVVGGADTDEDAGRGAAPACRGQPGVVERLPAHLEQQPLLRVHAVGLARRDTEERGSNDRRPSRNPPYDGRRGRTIGPDVPAVGRHLGTASTPSCNSRQYASGVVGAAGKTAAHADDGDRLACAPARLAPACPASRPAATSASWSRARRSVGVVELVTVVPFIDEQHLHGGRCADGRRRGSPRAWTNG